MEESKGQEHETAYRHLIRCGFDFDRQCELRQIVIVPSGSTRFQVMGSFKFDDGTRAMITIDSVFFGEQQISNSGRDEFVSCRIAFEADDFRVSFR